MRLEDSTDPESQQLCYVFDVMRPLRNKLVSLFLQVPPSLTAKEGLKKLEALINMLDPDFRYAIEVRHKSGFDRSVYKLLSDNNNICLACRQLETIQTPPELTSDFLFLLSIGFSFSAIFIAFFIFQFLALSLSSFLLPPLH